MLLVETLEVCQLLCTDDAVMVADLNETLQELIS